MEHHFQIRIQSYLLMSQNIVTRLFLATTHLTRYALCNHKTRVADSLKKKCNECTKLKLVSTHLVSYLTKMTCYWLTLSNYKQRVSKYESSVYFNVHSKTSMTSSGNSVQTHCTLYDYNRAV